MWLCHVNKIQQPLPECMHQLSNILKITVKISLEMFIVDMDKKHDKLSYSIPKFGYDMLLTHSNMEMSYKIKCNNHFLSVCMNWATYWKPLIKIIMKWLYLTWTKSDDKIRFSIPNLGQYMLLTHYNMVVTLEIINQQPFG